MKTCLIVEEMLYCQNSLSKFEDSSDKMAQGNYTMFQLHQESGFEDPCMSCETNEQIINNKKAQSNSFIWLDSNSKMCTFKKNDDEQAGF